MQMDSQVSENIRRGHKEKTDSSSISNDRGGSYGETGPGLFHMLTEWLNRRGFHYNPFAFPDSGEDPKIAKYMVGHQQYEKIRGPGPAAVFALAGSGKTAFRVRLAYECRSEEGLRAFPVVYLVPTPLPDEHQSQELRWQTLAQGIAHELFIYLAYHSLQFRQMAKEDAEAILQSMASALPLELDHYLNQLATLKNTEPLTDDYDRIAGYLPNHPGEEDLLALCSYIRTFQVAVISRTWQEHFEDLVQVVRTRLKFERIYILVDGVDAYYETYKNIEAGYAQIEWMVKRIDDWAKGQIYPKFFLPLEMEAIVRNEVRRWLTQKIEIVTIKWDLDSLENLIKERVNAATGAEYDSLDAISSLDLRRAERQIVQGVQRNPRAIILVTNQLLLEHVKNPSAGDRLTKKDLKAALEWYHQGQSET